MFSLILARASAVKAIYLVFYAGSFILARLGLTSRNSFCQKSELVRNDDLTIKNDNLISFFSINLLALHHECRSLIGYATHYLFCDLSIDTCSE